MAHEQVLPERKRSEELQLFDSAVQAVVDEVEVSLSLSMDNSVRGPGFVIDASNLPVYWAKGKEAADIRPADRNREQAVLAKMTKVVPVMHKLIADKIVTNDDDSKDLATGLMMYDGSPSAAARYLRGTASSTSLVDRVLEPRELVHALEIHQDMKDSTVTRADAAGGHSLDVRVVPSLSYVIRAADDWGIDLKHTIYEDHVADIRDALNEFSFMHVVSRADEYGEPYRTKHTVDATSLVRDPIGFTAIMAEDMQRDHALEAYMARAGEL